MDDLTSILLLLELQHEFSGLKIPGRLAKYGPPFKPKEEFLDADVSPVMTFIVQSCVFTPTLPGVNKVPDEFWSGELQPLLEKIGKHNLSDSYDHGRVSKRKMIGFAVIVVLHVLAKGLMGKAPMDPENNRQDDNIAGTDSSHSSSKTSPKVRNSLPTESNDINGVQKSLANVRLNENLKAIKYPSKKRLKEAYSLFVYGDGLDEIIRLLGESEDISNWGEPLNSLAENIRYTIASLLHFVFVTVDRTPQSPHLANDGKGPEGIVERIYNRVPWFLTRQVLRVGNAGLLMSGLTRLFLMKPLSWFGESRNLLQTMLSGIFSADLEHTDNVLKGIDTNFADDPKWTQMREALQWYAQLSRIRQDEVRDQSIQQKLNITVAILKEYQIEKKLNADVAGSAEEKATSETNVDSSEVYTVSLSSDGEKDSHKFDPFSDIGVQTAMKYFDAVLTHRDRECLIHDLCEDNQLTDIVREVMSCFYTIIYDAHQAADFSRAIYDFQCFLYDLIQLSKAAAPLSSFVELVEKYQSCFLRFVHRLIVNAPDLCAQWCVWYRHCLDECNIKSQSPDTVKATQDALNSLDDDTKQKVLHEIETYINDLEKEKEVTIEKNECTSEWHFHLAKLFGSAIITPTKAKGSPQPQLPECNINLTMTRKHLLAPFRKCLMQQLDTLYEEKESKGSKD
ncbi:DUF3818 and PXA domain conserved fungal protein [Schizosaccharomyces osmophilus]|uniref:DUF3818 and PXA domain conserved fungal protein n=1 Tax=Schizosaccharomyces osmophilus TaxID=2545709 RepID=A0AAF0AYD1_9SCHI|nr:DUF3818 and PXA domain conserved fungal protein [Schizosaccharomyces osmophilus]WBW74494.1 DUF3818 and PXA domain conserved fungal protein [Schizosaccharomyces osmophilus]